MSDNSDNNNIIAFAGNEADELARELTDWLLEQDVPVVQARGMVLRTLETLRPLRGLTLKVRLVTGEDPQRTINLSDTLTEGVGEALAPVIRSLAQDRVKLEHRLWLAAGRGEQDDLH